jgi:hypothetical protein
MASHKKKLRVLVVDDGLDTVHSTAVLLRDGDAKWTSRSTALPPSSSRSDGFRCAKKLATHSSRVNKEIYWRSAFRSQVNAAFPS